jgi:hypothetical protein
LLSKFPSLRAKRSNPVVGLLTRSKQASIIILLMIVFFITYKIIHRYTLKFAGGTFVTSVSTDGNYAITTNDNRYAILWNIKNKTHKIISDDANIYSAYFIKNTHYFMWQDLDNIVHIRSVDGKKIKSFQLSYPTYGQVMTSDLKHYIASDQAWNLFSGYGKDQVQIKKAYELNGFLGDGKLLNITLSNNDNYFVTSGVTGKNYDTIPLSAGVETREADKHGNYEVGIISASLLGGVTLWSTSSGQPLVKYVGNISLTHATLSPDGKCVVAGDVDDRGYIWDTTTGKEIFRIWDIWFGIPIKQDAYGTTLESDNKGLIAVPDDFKDSQDQQSDHYLAIKFIDATHYLRFTYDIPYAILYSITDPKPLKYLKLNTTPYPSIDDYARDQSIDTSPSTHILVIGHRDVPGITVYQYDPKTETLNMIWKAE